MMPGFLAWFLRPVPWFWVLDIGPNERQFRRIDLRTLETPIPSAVIYQRKGPGPGPRRFALRRADESGEYHWWDPYAEGSPDQKSPRNLYVDIVQCELKDLVKRARGIFHKLQTGLYITALIAIGIILFIVIIVLNDSGA